MLDSNDFRPVEERLRDWNEVTRPTPNYLRKKEQAQRCHDCGVPFCQSDSGCPVDNLIPEWSKLVAENRWEDAFHRLHLTNNFPEFTGSLCPAPCESACVLGINGNPVTIKSIEWSIVDRGYQEGWVRPQKSVFQTGKKIAIVGSGPAGLAAAQQLARKGHEVTVFEKNKQLGGLLRYGIPDFKFEKWRIDRRLDQLRAEGVLFQTSVDVGKGISFDELAKQFDAIGLAMGAEKPRDLEIPGRHLAGICQAMDYLVDQNQVIAKEKSVLDFDAKGKRVVILGGGDTGSDCLGTALRQRARSVVQIELQPKPPNERSPKTPWPLWPTRLKTSHAHEEGGQRLWDLKTIRFEGVNDHVVGLIAESVDAGADKNPQVTGQKSADLEAVVEADLVILALGFQGAHTQSVSQQLSLEPTSKGTLLVQKKKQTLRPGVFAAGDLTRGASLIVWAIADGRSMAEGIDNYLAR